MSWVRFPSPAPVFPKTWTVEPAKFGVRPTCRGPTRVRHETARPPEAAARPCPARATSANALATGRMSPHCGGTYILSWRRERAIIPLGRRGKPDLAGAGGCGTEPGANQGASRHPSRTRHRLPGRVGGSGRPAAPLPEEPPGFFAIGEETPASRLRYGSPLFRHHLRPKGRPRKPARAPLRPPQAEVDRWMLASALAAERGGTMIKQEEAEAACRTATNASRQQARVAFSRLPRDLRRGQGRHDRWAALVADRAGKAPSAAYGRYAFCARRRIYARGALRPSATRRKYPNEAREPRTA